MQDLRELIELGASLPGGEKLRRIIELASMEVRELGSRSITVPGTSVSMSIHIDSHCKVELRAWRRDENEALRVYEELRSAGYELTIYIEKGSHVISITHANIRDSPLKPIVCQKLSEWLNEARNERRKERIAKAIQNLECLTRPNPAQTHGAVNPLPFPLPSPNTTTNKKQNTKEIETGTAAR